MSGEERRREEKRSDAKRREREEKCEERRTSVCKGKLSLTYQALAGK